MVRGWFGQVSKTVTGRWSDVNPHLIAAPHRVPSLPQGLAPIPLTAIRPPRSTVITMSSK